MFPALQHFSSDSRSPPLLPPSGRRSNKVRRRRSLENDRRRPRERIRTINKTLLGLIDRVTQFAVSMLLQHLRSAEPTGEVVIILDFADPENMSIDIVRTFSATESDHEFR